MTLIGCWRFRVTPKMEWVTVEPCVRSQTLSSASSRRRISDTVIELPIATIACHRYMGDDALIVDTEGMHSGKN